MLSLSVMRVIAVLLVSIVVGFRTKPRSPGKGVEENLPAQPYGIIARPKDFPACHLSQSECSINDMTKPTLVYTDSDTSRCWNGEPFAFLVHPGARDKLLFNLPGGGACWENPINLPGAIPTCFSGMALGLGSTSNGSGVLDMGNPDNVFHDYTVVSPTYCNGGLHLANTTVKGILGTYYQYDYNNVEFSRSWFMKNLGPLQSFVMMGSSAGSLGVALWADFLLSTVNYRKASVILDSYVGVFPSGTQGTLFQNFETCDLPPLANFREACARGELLIEDVLDAAIAKHPNVAFAHVQSKTDFVQRAFYAVLALSYLNIPDLLISKSSFLREANALMQRFNKHPNYVTYLIDGSQHTFVPQDFWYTASVAGKSDPGPAGTPKLYEWVAQVVAHEQVESQCNGIRAWNSVPGWSYCDIALFPKTLSL